jgi:hypothetical protein
MSYIKENFCPAFIVPRSFTNPSLVPQFLVYCARGDKNTSVLATGTGKMKKLIAVFVVIMAFSITTAIAVDQHLTFKGLYVGMSADAAKKLGITECKKPDLPVYDEECVPVQGNKTFATIGGAPITKMQIAIDKNKVSMIYIETGGVYWDELSVAMKKKYGKPTVTSRKGLSYRWDKDTEFLWANVQKGKTVIVYSADTTPVKERERANKAPKDF